MGKINLYNADCMTMFDSLGGGGGFYTNRYSI